MRRILSQTQSEKGIKVDSFNFLNQFVNIPFLLKAVALLLIFMYAIFAFVIVNQVRTMNKIIYIPSSSGILMVISLIHLLLSISLFLASVVIL